MAVELRDLEDKCREIGRVIGKGIEMTYGSRDKVGFCLLLFDFGEGGYMTYISNAQRDDMILSLTELIDQLKENKQ